MGSTNYFTGYATFADEPLEGRMNTDTASAFDYLLTSCKDIEEVRSSAKQMNLVAEFQGGKGARITSFSWMRLVRRWCWSRKMGN